MPSKFNKFIGTWEVKNVTDMDNMFEGASNFDQNLTCWNVKEHFASKTPINFSVHSALASKHIPHWGLDPNIGCQDETIPQGANSFIINVIIPSDDMTFTWPIRMNDNTLIDCTIQWGDGTSDNISSKTSGAWTHVYTDYGVKSIAISGSCSAPIFEDYPESASKLTNITNWGSVIGATDWSGAFSGCFRLAYLNATDSFGTGVTNTAGMFYDCHSFIGNTSLSDWIMDDVIDTSYMFWNCDSFNQNVSGWNMASVENMAGMFGNDAIGMSIFNQDLKDWITDSVTNVDLMFKNAGAFNSNIGTWNMAGIIDPLHIWHMLDGTSSFRQNLTCWNVSAITIQILTDAGITDTSTFATGSLMPPDKKPFWGLAPNIACNRHIYSINVIPDYNSSISRFDARYWQVDYAMTANATIIADDPNELVVTCDFHSVRDLVGVIWKSVDQYDHPLFAYATNKDYTSTVLAFVANSLQPYALTATIKVEETSHIYRLYPYKIDEDEINIVPNVVLPLINGEGPGTSYLISEIFPKGIPEVATGNYIFVIDFNNIKLGFNYDGILVNPVSIDSIFLSLTPSTYDPLATEDTGIGVESLTFSMSSISCTGTGSILPSRYYIQEAHGLQMCSGYDDTYNITPWRQINNAYGLGYRGDYTLYMGMSHYPKTEALGSYDQRVVFGIDDPLNGPTVAWCSNLFKHMKAKDYKLIWSTSFEILASIMPEDWKQRNYIDQIGLSGWNPPSAFIIPAMPACITYLSNVIKQGLSLAQAENMVLQFQIGEPWWWDGSYTDGAPCIYGDFVKNLYFSETGNYAPIPYISDINATLDNAQLPFLQWLQTKLAWATNSIRDSVKLEYPEAKASLLLFSPQIVGASEVTSIINLPVNDWKYPAYDFMQIEDYDWIINGQFDLLPQTRQIAITELEYPISLVDYFVGFALNPNSPGIWNNIDIATSLATNSGITRISVWAYPQIIRDSIIVIL